MEEISAAGIVLAVLAGATLGIVLGGFLLWLVTKLALRIDLPFGSACWITFIVLCVTGVIEAGTHFLEQAPDFDIPRLRLISWVASLLAASWLYGIMITNPATNRVVGFGGGLLVSLVLLLIPLSIIALFFVIYLLAGAA